MKTRSLALAGPLLIAFGCMAVVVAGSVLHDHTGASALSMASDAFDAVARGG
jgi:hypothetical protein